MDYEKFKELIENKNYKLLIAELKDSRPADVADFLEEMDEKQALLIFRLLPKDTASDAFSHLSVERQLEISELVNEKELLTLINDLNFDDKVDLLEEMPAYVVKRILRNTNAVERKLINQFLMYPENSAGSLMTIELVELKKEMLVGEALDRIRQTGPDKETIYTCYITDAGRLLKGKVTLKDLVLSNVDNNLESIMSIDVISVNTHDDQEIIAELFKKYDLLALPVVDNEGRLVGIITIDDVVDVIVEENTEDIYKMAAIQPTDEEYISTGVFKLARKRILWLLILMISATFTGYIISSFEDALQSAVVLAVFIPMILGTGGNAGAQASTIIIRSIVLGEVALRDIIKVIWKEMRVSLMVGGVLSLFNFLRIYYVEKYSFEIALTVAVTLIFTVFFAKVLGGVLPIIAKKVKLDPAIMASPLITTIVDAASLIIYFYFAIWILGINR